MLISLVLVGTAFAIVAGAILYTTLPAMARAFQAQPRQHWPVGMVAVVIGAALGVAVLVLVGPPLFWAVIDTLHGRT